MAQALKNLCYHNPKILTFKPQEVFLLFCWGFVGLAGGGVGGWDGGVGWRLGVVGFFFHLSCSFRVTKVKNYSYPTWQEIKNKK